MGRVVRRPLAQHDIGEIWGYSAEDSVSQADKWMDALGDKLRSLAATPASGRRRDELVSGLRSVAFGRYVVFYALLSDGIDIVRVLHSARDVDAMLDHEGTSD